MTLDRFKQVCEDYGLYVEELRPYYVRAFFKNELVALFYEGHIYCYNYPFALRYTKTMMIYNGEHTEVYSSTELEENIVQTIEKLKKLFIIIKKDEIEREFK